MREIVIGALLTIIPALGLANPADTSGEDTTKPSIEKLLDISDYRKVFKNMPDEDLLALHSLVSVGDSKGDSTGIRDAIKSAIASSPVYVDFGKKIAGIQGRGDFLEENDHPREACGDVHPKISHERWVNINIVKDDDSIEEYSGAGAVAGYAGPWGKKTKKTKKRTGEKK